jgi:hypothetical protein
MTGHSCDQCGARYESPDDGCRQRFEQLLALDHSRQEPWGSRHGSAFAAFTLQHPVGQAREVLERCWLLLDRIWVAGDEPVVVTEALRHVQSGAPLHLTAPPLPPGAVEPRSFSITIADLGDFEAGDYPRLLEAWCRATLSALGVS